MKAIRIGTIFTLCFAWFAFPNSAFANHSSVPNVNVEESDPLATIWVHSDCGPRGTYRTEDGTAKAGEDYEAVTGQFTRPQEGARPGTSSFQIPLIDDKIRESDETVRVIVTLAPENVMFGVGTAGCGISNYNEVQTIEATLTILDDDSPLSPKGRGSGSSAVPSRSSSGAAGNGAGDGPTGSAGNLPRSPFADRSWDVEASSAGDIRVQVDSPFRTGGRRGPATWSLFLIGVGTTFTAGAAALWWRKRLGGRMT